MSYIGNRKHLEPLIAKMLRYDKNTKKFALVLSGEKDEVSLGYPEKETAKLFCVNQRTKIILCKKYALHMDNSGHFTGVGYGVYKHNDKRHLTIEEISNIPEIIKTAKEQEVFNAGVVRGNQRYNIIRKTTSNQFVVVEIIASQNKISLVSAYNISERQYRKIH